MELSNKIRARKIKQRFNLVVFCFFAAALYTVWRGEDMAVILIGIALAIFIVCILVINYNYLYFSTNNNRVTVKYYPVISLFNRDYSTIEFPQDLLFKYELKSSALFSDLTLTVKTKRGIADYPQISLTALKKEDIEQIRQELERILEQLKHA